MREAQKRSNQVGVAKVVIASKQHLAVLIPCGPALALNLLRWGGPLAAAYGTSHLMCVDGSHVQTLHRLPSTYENSTSLLLSGKDQER